MTATANGFEALVDSAPAAPPATERASQPLPVRIPVWLRAAMRAASVVAPAVAARVAYDMFFTPPRFPPRAPELEILGRARRSSLGGTDRQIAVYTWGDGPTVLLVHGWGGHAGHMAGFVDPLLAAGFRAVAIDLPGHGRSSGRRSSLVHFAQAIELAEAALGPFAGLVAHSFGGPSSTYALARGMRADRVVYVAPAAQFQLFWDRFGNGVGAPSPIMSRVMQLAEKRLGVRFDEIAPLTLAPTLSVPLLVLHGADDRETPPSEGRMLAGAWPGAELRELPSLGHMRILWDAATIAEAVGFLTAAR